MDVERPGVVCQTHSLRSAGHSYLEEMSRFRVQPPLGLHPRLVESPDALLPLDAGSQVTDPRFRVLATFLSDARRLSLNRRHQTLSLTTESAP